MDSKPTLYIFGISHYCEKARWILDYYDIDYKINYLSPGMHIQVAKKLGAPSSTLPILIADGQVVQGSNKIIDWTQNQLDKEFEKLTSNSHLDEYHLIEKRLDDVIGVHIRRYYYSEALVEYPETVRTLFFNDVTFFKKLILYTSWHFVRKSMIDIMDLGPEQQKQSRDIVDEELSWIDELVGDGKNYLVGNNFSRADLTAASLISPLAMPAEHPKYANVKLPPLMAGDLELWEGRPSIKWVREIYQKHR